MSSVNAGDSGSLYGIENEDTSYIHLNTGLLYAIIVS